MISLKTSGQELLSLPCDAPSLAVCAVHIFPWFHQLWCWYNQKLSFLHSLFIFLSFWLLWVSAILTEIKLPDASVFWKTRKPIFPNAVGVTGLLRLGCACAGRPVHPQIKALCRDTAGAVGECGGHRRTAVVQYHGLAFCKVVSWSFPNWMLNNNSSGNRQQ